ncbi:MAG TPA: ribonuclease HI family protein [Terriglobales bacterium]|nr:ribonuclease HI family protein [Terriglobales bacterium]
MPFSLYTSSVTYGSPSGTGRLFTGGADTPERFLVANIDGGARGNPGPAGYGVHLKDQSGKKVAELSRYLGHQTNNYAEYSGLIAALEYAIQHGPKALKVISDSELLVKQIKGEYKVKSPSLQELYARARQLIRQLDWFSIQHVLRSQNREADGLANAAMDQAGGRMNTAGARSASATAKPTQAYPAGEEFEGIVRDGRIELLNGELVDGTRVQVRIKK